MTTVFVGYTFNYLSARPAGRRTSTRDTGLTFTDFCAADQLRPSSGSDAFSRPAEPRRGSSSSMAGLRAEAVRPTLLPLHQRLNCFTPAASAVGRNTALPATNTFARPARPSRSSHVDAAVHFDLARRVVLVHDRATSATAPCFGMYACPPNPGNRSCTVRGRCRAGTARPSPPACRVERESDLLAQPANLLDHRSRVRSTSRWTMSESDPALTNPSEPARSDHQVNFQRHLRDRAQSLHDDRPCSGSGRSARPDIDVDAVGLAAATSRTARRPGDRRRGRCDRRAWCLEFQSVFPGGPAKSH